MLALLGYFNNQNVYYTALCIVLATAFVMIPMHIAHLRVNIAMVLFLQASKRKKEGY